ncbi:hypothetical protein SAMN06295888_101108 [Desulfonatronum zhilinae]|nr:hypothetical protein SAMN06295888_101108 [Desulfonatronum zhilinae]
MTNFQGVSAAVQAWRKAVNINAPIYFLPGPNRINL